MKSTDLNQLFSRSSTPLICDACLRLGVRYDMPNPGIRPLRSTMRIAGRVLPARHYGSVDVFLEAFETEHPRSMSSGPYPRAKPRSTRSKSAGVRAT
jgi:hypothetical protein